MERRAFVVARLATSNRDEALDIVQDAMTALVSRYRDKPAAEWGPLFYTILQSRIEDWRRRNKVRNRFRVWFGRDDGGEDPLQNLPERASAEPERQWQGQAGRLAIEAALRQLPARQQQAFLLRAWEGYDVQTTAAAMRCSEGSVKTHFSRAVHALREQLRDHWHDE